MFMIFDYGMLYVYGTINLALLLKNLKLYWMYQVAYYFSLSNKNRNFTFSKQLEFLCYFTFS
jgi:hypothetical protein